MAWLHLGRSFLFLLMIARLLFATEFVRDDPHTIWIADAHRGDGKRFVARADEKLTAFIKLESAIRGLPLQIPAERADQATPYIKIGRCRLDEARN